MGELPADAGTGKPYLPQQMTGRSRDDVWVVGRASGERRNVVFHSRRASHVTEL
jgi:hypothetical protein